MSLRPAPVPAAPRPLARPTRSKACKPQSVLHVVCWRGLRARMLAFVLCMPRLPGPAHGHQHASARKPAWFMWQADLYGVAKYVT